MSKLKRPEFGQNSFYFTNDSKTKFNWTGIQGHWRMLQLRGKDGKMYKEQLVGAFSNAEVVIIVRDLETQPKIAMLIKERPAVLDPKLYSDEWNNGIAPDPLQYIEELGVVQYELPRGGFIGHFGTEGEEETGFILKNQKVIGRISHDTGYMMTAPYIVLAEATETTRELDAEELASLKGLEWLTPEELLKIETLDTYTESSLRLLRKYLLSNSEGESAWEMLAARL